ncbi:hypothetical protein J5N97_004329 [Dioscorea zingiberensis]|uniref:CCHC-type domain-containing protein n=1 Tax=Dioscorea zingiberensis TaxID=325984 RepID=A0A9D5D866_9LILI|nr:hypothetical protein J5N97_004329 [Dioscorea zingiberensis]
MSELEMKGDGELMETRHPSEQRREPPRAEERDRRREADGGSREKCHLGKTTTAEKAGETGRTKEPWRTVRNKKKKQRCLSMGGAGPSQSSYTSYYSLYYRHPPPRKRTSEGVIEVCGKCRQPGHLMVECRREEVCRRCERQGHREAKCTSPPKALVSRRLQGGAKTEKMKGDGAATTVLTTIGDWHGALVGPNKIPAPEEGEINSVSLAVDEDILAEMEEMKQHSMVSVVKVMAGIVDHRMVVKEIGDVFGPELS